MKSPSRRFRLTLGLFVAACGTAHAASDYATPYSFTTVAGISSVGSDDGSVALARFYSPHGVAVDTTGNLYVADKGNHTIRKITPAGVVTIFAGKSGHAGTQDGTGNEARFNQPFGVAVDSSGNVYVADTINCTIRKITPVGAVTTLAGSGGLTGSVDGTGSAARFSIPSGLTVDSAGNVFVADSNNNTIRKVTPAGVVTTFAGTAGVYSAADGPGPAAGFFYPVGMATDAAGNIYVSEAGNLTIRKITPAGVTTTLVAASTGVIPQGVAVDVSGNVFFSDHRNVIRKLAPGSPAIVLAGTVGEEGAADGTGSAARFRSPFGLAADAAGNVYVADRNNNTIRKIAPAAVVTTVAGLGLEGSVGSTDGSAPAARFAPLASAAISASGDLYVADPVNSTIRKISATGSVTTFAGLAGQRGDTNGTGNAARFDSPVAVAVDPAGTVYVADAGNDTIRKITAAGVVTTLAGDAGAAPGSADGTGAAARFNYPAGLALDGTGTLYVADNGNFTIRKVTPAGVVTTLAGSPGSSGHVDSGTVAAARFVSPKGVAVDAAGTVYVADSADQGFIRKVTPTGVVSTLAGGIGGDDLATDGTGAAARFGRPQGIALDATGNLYVADTANQLVRKITSSGVVTTLAGLAAAPGSADNIGRDSRFYFPQGLAVDAGGSVYVVSGPTVRKGRLAGSPVIGTQPASQTVTAGGAVTFSVAASGAPDPVYQWYLNGSAIASATSPSLALANVQAANAGDYTVVVTNPLGTLTSAKATLAVTATPVPPPPAPSGSGGGGGGGAPSVWFMTALLLGATHRVMRAKSR